MPPRWLQSVINGIRQRDADMITFEQDPLARSFNLEQHCLGEFSMANVQSNTVMEDQSHVEVAIRNTLFLGVYDGHGGVDASLFCLNHLFNNLLRFAQANDNSIAVETLSDAVADTESQFLEYVEADIHRNQQLGKIGSCCLAGVFWRGTLYIANLGDSRAVMGSVVDRTLQVHQLTRDHNCSDPAIRQEVQALHPNDPTIVIQRDDGSWRVKGIITVSRSIGDAYLKRPPFSLQDSFPAYEPPVPEPFTRAVLSAQPEMSSRAIADTDKFLIFASDGLWDYMTNQEVADIVHNFPKHGIAKRILSITLARAAATRLDRTYRDLLTLAPGREGRRAVHDDISVIVIFLDRRLPFKKRLLNVSYRGSNTKSVPSEFAGSKLIDKTGKPSTAKSLKNSITKRFKGSSSRQTTRNTENLNLLDMSDTSEAERDKSSRPKSRWGKLKRRFTLKKH